MSEYTNNPQTTNEILKELISNALSIKEKKKNSVLLREPIPASKWVNDEYYVGQAGLYLYPYWKKELIDIFETNRGKYNELIITGGIGCRPYHTTHYHTDKGFLTLPQIKELMYDNKKVHILGPYARPVRVTNVHYVGEKPTITIRFSNGYIMTATTDHRVKVVNRDNLVVWKEFQELDYDSKVLISNVPELTSNRIFPLPLARLLGFIAPKLYTWNTGYRFSFVQEQTPINILEQLEFSELYTQYVTYFRALYSICHIFQSFILNMSHKWVCKDTQNQSVHTQRYSKSIDKYIPIPPRVFNQRPYKYAKILKINRRLDKDANSLPQSAYVRVSRAFVRIRNTGTINQRMYFNHILLFVQTHKDFYTLQGMHKLAHIYTYLHTLTHYISLLLHKTNKYAS